MGKLFKAISTILCVSIIFSVFSIPAYADNLLDPTYDPMWEAFSKTWGDMTEVAFTCPKCGANIRKKDGGTCPSCGFNAIIDDGTENNYRPGFQAGGGSASPGGVGRHPSGYVNDNGTPYIGSSGALYVAMEHDYIGFKSDFIKPFRCYCNHYNGGFSSSDILSPTYICRDDYMSLRVSSSSVKFYPDLEAGYKLVAPIDGYYSVVTCPQYSTICDSDVGQDFKHSGEFAVSLKNKLYAKDAVIKLNKEYSTHAHYNYNARESTFFRAIISGPVILKVEPLDPIYKQQTNITINNNTWNGNIYVDSTNKLTYIYPKYTVNNEVNISNNPIIYNNETKQYYTYNSETKNYYYITINAPESTPTPTPSPDVPTKPIVPDTQSLIIPKMNANTFTDDHGTWIASGSSKYSDVFDFFYAFDRSSANFWETNVSPCHLQIEIPDPESYYIDGYIMRISKFNNRYSKDWTLQGSDDGKTWDDLDKQTGQNLSDMEEHKYTLTLRKSYKYYRLNMSNYASSMCSLSHFNLLGYAAKDVTFPTPDPGGSGGGSGTTPAPTPAPTPGGSGGGSGDTNNFWNIIIKDNNKTDKEHKGIFWALISLLIAAITFVVNMLTAYKYLFPFLPDGVIAVINTCVAVLMIFVIIKFVMRVIK